MKDVTGARGLRHVKTATTRHLHTKPPLRGTSYLEMFLLGKEKQRLEQELAHLEDRRGRIQGQLAEIAQALTRLEQAAQSEGPGRASESTGSKDATIPVGQLLESGHSPWKTMTVGY